MKQIVICENSRRLGVPVYANENNFEHALTYNRAQDGSRVEMALVHVPGREPVFVTAIYPADANPNDAPSAVVELSLDEMRVRYAYVEHLREIGLFKPQA